MKFLLCLLLASPALAAEKPAAHADATPQPATLQAPAQAGPAQKDAEQQPVATVTKVTGDVLVRHAQAWGRVTEVPLELLSGDTVSTDRGRAEVHFLRDDSTLVLDVGTHLTIAEAEGGTAGNALRRIEIFLGDVWFQMQRGLNHKTELATPTAVGGLRGTQGLVRVKNAEQSEFTLAEGELEMTKRARSSGSAGEQQSVRLTAGQTMRAHRDQPLQAGKAAALPTRPALNVAANQLPKPRNNWRELVSKSERPPGIKQVQRLSGRTPQSGAKLEQTAKASRSSKRPKPTNNRANTPH